MTLYRIREDMIREKGKEVTHEISRKERKEKLKEARKEAREVVGRYFEGKCCRSGGTLVMVSEGGSVGEGKLDRVTGVATCLVMLRKRRMREAEHSA